MHQSEQDMQVVLEGDGTCIRSFSAGGMLSSLMEMPAGTDFTPALRGLPQNLCPSEHWGYVIEGSIHLRYADGTEETTSAGQVFHWPALHTAWTTEKVRFFEVGPHAEMTRLLDHVTSAG